MDKGHEATERKLRALEKKIAKEYAQAEKELEQKLQKYLKAFERKDALKRAALDAGEITDAEYKQWRTGQIMIGKRWTEMRDTLAEDLTHSNQIALSMVNGYMPEVYALNHDYATFEIEKGGNIDTSYTLYDRQTVERLMRDNPKLLPKRKIDVPKDLKWNQKLITSAVTQGILQGEPITDIAKRLRKVTDMDKNASIRNARTITTGAENAGRVAAAKRAQGMGIDVEQIWIATLDGRTRHTHRQLDGEHRKVGKKFSNGCMFPADPDGPPQEVYNCRCTLGYSVDGVDFDASDLTLRDSRLGNMSYEEWREGHGVSKHYNESVAQYNQRVAQQPKAQPQPAKAPTERKIEYSPRSQEETPKENKYRNLENIGYTREQIDEAQRLLYEHSGDLDLQEIADKEILEHIEKRDTTGKLFIDKSELEEQAWKLEIEQERAKAYADYIEKIEDAKDSLRTGGIYSNYTEQDLKDWGLWPEKFDFSEPKFYRKGGMGGNILSFSKSSSGAGMSFLTHGDDGYIGYDISYTLSEMIEMGYHPIAGIISFDVGQSGEAEVLFAKFNRIKRRR